jgi:hypothetical protein
LVLAVEGRRVSGGSFDYLYGQETLVGKHELVAHMAEYTRDRAARKDETRHVEGEWVPFTLEDKQDLLTAADELDKLATWLEHVEYRADGKQEFYRDLLKSVEWACSGDSGADGIIDAYRELLEK